MTVLVYLIGIWFGGVAFVASVAAVYVRALGFEHFAEGVSRHDAARLAQLVLTWPYQVARALLQMPYSRADLGNAWDRAKNHVGIPDRGPVAVPPESLPPMPPEQCEPCKQAWAEWERRAQAWREQEEQHAGQRTDRTGPPG